MWDWDSAWKILMWTVALAFIAVCCLGLGVGWLLG